MWCQHSNPVVSSLWHTSDAPASLSAFELSITRHQNGRSDMTQLRRGPPSRLEARPEQCGKRLVVHCWSVAHRPRLARVRQGPGSSFRAKRRQIDDTNAK